MKKFVKESLYEEMGGVSAPMATLTNTPGVGNATPAASAGLNTDGPSGSGDKWDDASIGMQTNEDLVAGMQIGLGILSVGYLFVYGMGIKMKVKEFLEDRKIRKIVQKVSKEPEIKEMLKDPDSFMINNDSVRRKIEKYLSEEEKEYLHKIKHIDFDYEYFNESNINPYDKIGQMMAKKMGVKSPFQKGDSRTNTVVQSGWEELDEEQPNSFMDIDDYVSNPDKVMNNAKKRKLGMNAKLTESSKSFGIITLDDYVKASKHVPDHPLTTVKKGMIKEGDALRDDNALKDVKAKDALSQLGIGFEFKPGKSGVDRVFITDPIPEVLKKLEQGEWEEYGKNPENTIKKFEKAGKLLTIFADGKDLPRAIITNKVEEKLQIRKVVSNSLDPYTK